jgi:anti-anti-sigma regulatory factor
MDQKTQKTLEGFSEAVALFLQGDTDARVAEPSSEPGIEALRTRVNALLDQAAGDAESFHKINMSMADILTDWYGTLKQVRAGDLDARVPVGDGDEFLDRMSEELNGTLATLKDLQEESERRRIALIEQQSKIIEELSTPIIQVWDGVLALPVIGIVDSARAQEMMEKLLDRVVSSQTRCVILDLTGVTVIDTKTADYLIKMVKAATLVGASCTVTGIGPSVAQTITRMGLDLQGVVTLRDLRDGLKHAFTDLGLEVRQKER